MATTNREIAQNVIAELSHLGQETAGIFIPDIVAHIQDTIDELVSGIAEQGTPGDRKLLQKIFSITITPQTGFDTVDLSTALNGTGERMFLELPFPSVSHPDSQSGQLLWVGDFANLTFANPAFDGEDYYTVDGTTLYINATPELTGNLIIRSFYFPIVTTLPTRFERMVVDMLVTKFTKNARK